MFVGGMYGLSKSKSYLRVSIAASELSKGKRHDHRTSLLVISHYGLVTWTTGNTLCTAGARDSDSVNVCGHLGATAGAKSILRLRCVVRVMVRAAGNGKCTWDMGEMRALSLM